MHTSNNLIGQQEMYMTDQVQSLDYGFATTSVEQRNRVLRNTYWLLALSLVPTVLGAWLGVATGITRGLSGGIGLMVFLGGAFAFMFAIEKTKNSAAGVNGRSGRRISTIRGAGNTSRM